MRRRVVAPLSNSRIAAGALIIHLALLTGSAPAYDIADYFYLPQELTPTTAWHYADVTQHTPGDTDAFEWRVLGSRHPVGSEPAAHMLQTLADEGASEDRHEDIDLFRLNPLNGQLEYWGGRFKKLAEDPYIGSYLPEYLVFNTPVLFGQAGMEIGQQIDSQGSVTIGGLPLGASATIGATGKIVVVDWLPTKDTFMGVFQDVLVVDVTLGISVVTHSFLGNNEVFNDTFLNNRFYLARHCGLVYQVQNTDQTDATEQSIDRGHLQGVPLNLLDISVQDTQTSEDGDTLQFTVALTRQPTLPVTVLISSSDPGEGVVSGPVREVSVQFNSTDWDQPRVISVTGQDDDDIDGDITYQVHFDITPGDGPYLGPVPVLTFVNLDNDAPAAPGVTLAMLDAETSEDGDTGSFTIRLKSQPTAPVQVTVQSEDLSELEIESAIPARSLVLTFTTEDWNQDRLVTVRGVDDAEKDGDVSVSVSISLSSADPEYDQISVPPLLFINRDNDMARIDIRDYFVLDPPESFWRYVPFRDPEPGVSRNTGLRGNVFPATAGYLWTIESDTQLIGEVQAVRLRTDSADPDVENAGVVQFWSLTAGGNLLNHGMFQPREIHQEIQGVGMVFPPQDILFEPPLLIGTANMMEGQTLQTDATAQVTYTFAGSRTSPRLQMPIDVSSAATLLAVMPVKETPMGRFHDVAVIRVSIETPFGTQTTILFAAPESGVIAQKEGADPTIPDGWALVLAEIGMEPLQAPDPNAGVNVFVADPYTSEDLDTARLTVSLISEPAADVSLTISSDTPAEGVVLPDTLREAVLHLSPVDWHLERAVKIIGVDDAIVDGDQDYTLSMTLSSDDATFSGTLPELLQLTNLDNDFAISGLIEYSGSVPAERIIVRAWQNNPLLSRDAILAAPGTFRIDPLPAGTYTLMAWVDMVANQEWDPFEPIGYYETRTAATLTLPPSQADIRITIMDNDTDSDDDLLPDWYEMITFGDLAESGNGDFDGDGETNHSEYLNQTDPRDARSTQDPSNRYTEFLFELLRSGRQLPNRRALADLLYGAAIACEAPQGAAFISGSVQLPRNSPLETLELTLDAQGQALSAVYQPEDIDPAAQFAALQRDFCAGTYLFDLLAAPMDRQEPFHLRFSITVPDYTQDSFPDFALAQTPQPGQIGVPLAPLLETDSHTWYALDLFADTELLYSHLRDATDQPPNTHQVPGTLPQQTLLTLRLVQWDAESTWLASHTLSTFTTARLIELLPGWNFLSIPTGLPAGGSARTVSAVFGKALNARGSGAWAFDPIRQRYLDAVAAEPLSETAGYWVYAPTGATLDYSGGDTPPPTQIQLQTGWNAIAVPAGLPSYAVDVLFAHEAVIATWTWDAAQRAYVHQTDQLVPAQAYWVYATGPVLLALP